MKRGILFSLIFGVGIGLLTTGILGFLFDGITIPIVITGIGAFLISFVIDYKP